jgi:valyl-tRNA synthetase
MNDMEMEKVFNPQAIEADLYREWEENGYFKAERDENKKPFTIVMPPPNVTGQLHMGHAMDNTWQDILIRFRRMQGYAALWVPGTDHASIATEAKVVAAMKEEGLTKEMLGRDGFLERAWAWKHQYGNRIVSQLKRLGSSCDWSRERFTMDEGCSDAVKEVFVRLYKQGLIYRGNRMVNWCPHCKTSISDAEVEYEEKEGSFWHLLYTVKETGEQLELATTRPETMLGDTAVAINPEDGRYAHLHGCHVILPLLGKEIPIVCDEHADMEKGTGVVKITPAHDPNDFEVGRRHGLPMIRVLTYEGIMTGAADQAEADALRASGRAAADEPEVLDCGKYAGMTAQEARKAVLEDLRACGALKETEAIRHDVGTCYRCHSVIEPMVSKQWFVKMEQLAGPAIEAVENGDIRYVPERFTKTYMNWMRNTRDWCISRQLWWGHQIPVWYCADCGETIVAKEAPCACGRCGGRNLTQDPDTLDTWFSSALWPFSTLGWPNEESADFKYFYPTDVLVTGYDIISFWVSRMIFSALAYTGRAPFHTVLIHGIVRDAQGRKMSKSLGNGIDPLEVIDQYGADALRFSLLMGVSPGNDTRFSTEKVEAARNFANKVWNASRFVMMNLDGYEPLEGKRLADSDKWILTRFDDAVREVTQHLEEYDLGMAAQKVYDFIWSQFCDWYIELSKARLQGEDKKTVQAVLIYVLTGMLKLLHPFMPFLTDAVYRFVPGTQGSVMLADWPEARDGLRYEAEAAQMEGVMDIIRAVRNLRAEMNVAVGRRAHLMLRAREGWRDTLAQSEAYFGRLAWVSELAMLAEDAPAPEKTVSAVCAAAELYIPLGDLVDIEKETARLEKERKALEGEIARAQGKLSNPGFVGKAPAALVEKEREKLEVNRGMLESLKARIESLRAL